MDTAAGSVVGGSTCCLGACGSHSLNCLRAEARWLVSARGEPYPEMHTMAIHALANCERNVCVAACVWGRPPQEVFGKHVGASDETQPEASHHRSKLWTDAFAVHQRVTLQLHQALDRIHVRAP